MNSVEIKKLMIKRCTFANGYVGAVTEAANLNAADVIAVKFGGKIQEFEIKVSKKDLVGEMRCARVAIGIEKHEAYIHRQVKLQLESDGIIRTPEQVAAVHEGAVTLSKTKLKKHRMYLTEEGAEPESFYGFVSPKPFIPNTFYWCIPYSLLEVCKELNKGLPYGIYVYDMPQESSWKIRYIVSPARSLGGQGDKLYFELFNRACTQWGEDRGVLEYLQNKEKK